MSRAYFQGMDGPDPSIASGTALVGTGEEDLITVARYGLIAANDAKAGKAYKITAGGICTFASTGLISFTPRLGLLVSSPTMGVTVNPVNVPGVATNVPWLLEYFFVCRLVGAPGANSTFIGTGHCSIGGLATAGQAIDVTFGGTLATADSTIATGCWIGKTLTVAGSFTTQYAFIQPLN